MSRTNPITAGRAAIGRGDVGLGTIREEADLLRRCIDDLGGGADLVGDVARFEEAVKTLDAEWTRIGTAARALIDEKGPSEKWE